MDIQDFILGWRFTDPKFNQLPESDLKRIKPFSPEESQKLWDKHVSKNKTHISQMEKENFPSNSFRIDWDNEELAKELASKEISINPKQNVIFFWSPVSAASVDWEIVLKYLTDFFYPDDDNTVVVVPESDYRIFFHEETFFILKP